MNIQSISGPDFIPEGFSVEPPVRENSSQNSESSYRNDEIQEENKGNNFDSYA